jgi:chromosomal replication initiator protein
MHEVQIIPFSGKPLELDFEGAGSVRFPSSAHGFLLGQENGILEPLIQEIIDGRIMPERLPILLYGTLGSGRTHLLKGILETWRKNQTHEPVRRQAYYLSCADFYRQFTDAVATHTTDIFRQRYRRAKLLLLDDLEQLLGKSSAQAELRLLLDDFAGIIVLTAQTLPADMETGKTNIFSEDLAERIQGGTTIPIFLPGEAVRRRFLQDLASALRIPFSEPLLNGAAKALTGTIPQLYAAVAQKYVEAKSANEPLEAAFWQQFSQKRKSNNTPDMMDIAKRTATYFSLKLGDIRGDSRSKTVALARSIAVYLARSQLRLSFKEIGHFFGKRDPSTVRHLFEKVERNLQTDTELCDHLFRLEMR